MGRTSLLRLQSVIVVAVYVVSLVMLLAMPRVTTADALINYGGSDVSVMVEDIVSLSGITVSGTDPIIPLTLSIDDGILRMNTMDGLDFSSGTSGSTLQFSGSVTDINNALATLEYRSDTPGEKTLSATIIPDGLVYYPGNGHLYEVVDNGDSINWTDAKTAAEGRTMNGASGYLATVTTQAENDYLVGRLSGDGWFGASDAETEGEWKWVTGPEAATQFWQGLGDGSAVGGLFSNWAGGEPNEFGDGEDCAQFYSDGSGWNDLHCVNDTLNYYVVEYGAPGDMPTAPASVSLNVEVTMPPQDVVPIASCLDLIDVADNVELDNRYDTLQLTDHIDCTGETLQPMFDDQDIDFGNIGFRGTFDGNGYAINNIDIDSFTDNVGLFAITNGATFTDLTVRGTVDGNYCTGGLVGTATNTNFTAVTSEITVTGGAQVGGVVGCYVARNNAENTLDNIVVVNSVTTNDDDALGGVIGDFESYDASSTTFSAINADSTFSAAYNRVGGVIGEVDMEDSSMLEISGVTIDSINTSVSTVGGVIGEVDMNDTASLLIQTVSITGYVFGGDEVGGVIGEFDNYGSLADNAALRNVHIATDIEGYESVGGLAGEAYLLLIEDSSYSGTIVATGYNQGGLVGEAEDVIVRESYTSGTLDNSTGGNIGGLFGYSNNSVIEESYSSMTSNEGSTAYVGGLVGYLAYDSEIHNSYARGNVAAGSYVGGLVGSCEESMIHNAYAAGVASSESGAGGLVGDGYDCVSENSFWDIESSTQSSSLGDETGKTTVQMKTLETFTNTATVGLDVAWDFDTVWGLAATINDGYPCLQWQDEDCVGIDPDDSDTDGVTTVIESAAPNSGDANDDGTPDSLQNFVSSFVNPVTNEYAVVEIDSACSLEAVSAESEDAKTVKDSGYTYASGLVNFTANCGTPGYETTVRVIKFNKDNTELVLRKHNPINGSYFTITDAVISDVVIGGVPAVSATYTIVDGGSLDTDGLVNGTIVDPVGLASLVVGVPNTGFQRR